MGNSAAEIFSFVLVILSIGSFILSGTTDCWREDAKDPYSSVGLSSRCRGLWSECVYDNMADLWTCDIPVSYLSDHPVGLVITRALVIITGVLCIAAAPLLLLGMKCTTFLSSADRRKVCFSTAAGIMLLAGGIAGAVAVSWFAVDTALKYRAEVGLAVPGITYELGYSYWLAAASAAGACVPALLLIGLNCRRNPTAEKEANRASQCRSHHNATTYL
ncbi:claudin-16-like [Spea bombifrons]|uniref:claudin-16-like n=1 Tax=Spea bombifrons TaxID=233779 RepID=UPI00234AAF02|nr:claudin-16-like [Spea bombifrons]